MLSRVLSNLPQCFVEEDEIQLSLNLFRTAFPQFFPQLKRVKIVVIGIFEISHLEVKFSQKQVIVVNLFACFKYVFCDLNGCSYPLDGQVVLTELFETNGAVYDSIDQSSVVYVCLAYLDALVVLSLSLFEHLVLIKIIRMFEKGSPVLDLTIVLFYKFEIFSENPLGILMHSLRFSYLN